MTSTISEPAKRPLMMAAIILSTVMPAIDTTIANVALPVMAGSMSATPEQITWVLTSYIVALAVVTPISGWLANRFGRKNVFLVSVLGFTFASVLCGAAQSLEQVILFRALQGAFAAPGSPLCQAVILDNYEAKERGPVLALWTMSLMVSPILGPVLGGVITDALGWRWVFYINLPVGLLAAAGVALFVPDSRRGRDSELDFVGFAFLSMFVICLQLLLDRGQSRDWFASTEIVSYALLAGVGLYLFVVQMLTAERPFIPPGILQDRNLVAATVLNLAVCMEIFSALALVPLLMQNFMGYPVEAAGWALAPRGVASFLASFAAGRLVTRVDNRALILFALGLFAFSFWQLGGASPAMDAKLVILTGVIQGAASGLIFVPLNNLAFATLRPSLRGDAASFFSLARNLGSSVGISIIIALHTWSAQRSHAHLAEFASPENPLMRPTPLTAWHDMASVTGLATLDAEIARQSSIQAYVEVFQLLVPVSLMLMPLVFLMRQPAKPAA